MRWFGHVEHSTGWTAEVRKLNVVAQKRSGRPRKSWDEVLENDRKKLGMDSADPQNRSEWRGCLRERLVKPEDHWSCIAHLIAEDMLKSAVTEEKTFKHSPWVGADNPLGPKFRCQQVGLITMVICCKFTKNPFNL